MVKLAGKVLVVPLSVRDTVAAAGGLIRNHPVVEFCHTHTPSPTKQKEGVAGVVGQFVALVVLDMALNHTTLPVCAQTLPIKNKQVSKTRVQMILFIGFSFPE